jgi:hypothetical protein
MALQALRQASQAPPRLHHVYVGQYCDMLALSTCPGSKRVFASILNIVNVTTVALLVLLTGVYVIRYRKADPAVFSPAAAWLRACIFFCACFIAAWLSGTQQRMLDGPVVTPEQLQDPRWLLWTGGFAFLIIAGYWGVWARYTIRFERRRHLPSQIPFGVLWGLSVGQFILVVWHGVTLVGAGWPAWAIILVSWIGAGTMFALWMLFYWDLYIAPEHDSRYSIALKTIVVHIPQTLVCVTYLTLFDRHSDGDARTVGRGHRHADAPFLVDRIDTGSQALLTALRTGIRGRLHLFGPEERSLSESGPFALLTHGRDGHSAERWRAAKA